MLAADPGARNGILSSIAYFTGQTRLLERTGERAGQENLRIGGPLLTADPALIIDASHRGELRLAWVKPGAVPSPAAITRYPAGDLPTFTDGLLRFERDSGIPLRGAECVISIPGVTCGESLPIMRSRWTISRSGLAALFGRPATIINDTAARAWAMGFGTGQADALRGQGRLDLRRHGRYTFLNVEEGVGAAVIDVDEQSAMRVLECEAGHIDFAPASAAEMQLAEASTSPGTIATWEQVLLSGVANGAIRSHSIADTHAALLGRFAANLVLAHGAWQGVIMTGSRTAGIVDPVARAAFDRQFTGRSDFRRLLSLSPCWRVHQAENVMTGAAALIASRYGTDRPQRAAA